MSYPEQEKNTENKVSNLLYRSGVYYFYCRIPSDLQRFFPHTESGNFQKHIKRTLKTKIYDEAIKRIIPFNAQYADLIKVLEVKTMPEASVRQHIRAFGFKFPDDEVPEPIQLVAAPKKIKKYLLSQLMDLYTNTSKDGWNGRTPRLVAHSLRLILYILGDIPVADIDRAKCRYVRDQIFKLPPDMFYHPLLKDIPIETAIKYVEDGVLSVAAPNSIKKHMTTLSTLMKFGAKEDIIIKNFAEGLYSEQKKRRRKERGVKRESLQKNARLPVTVNRAPSIFPLFFPLS